jgi:hypothetical protein
MDSTTPFNLMIFTDSTKKVCLCSATSIFLIVLFIISPLSNFFKTSMFMKVVALIIMIYTIYLSSGQINSLIKAIHSVKSEQIKSQLNMNLMCSYVFTVFIGLLIIFVIKSFF